MNQPIPSIQRLPIYLRFLKGIRNDGDIYVSCTRIAEEFGQLSVQVRKDLGITGIVGRPKIGYQIEELITAIEHFLGWDKKTNAFLVGVGNLGTAVLNYPGFVEHGLNILAAFDNDPKKQDLVFQNCKVYDLDLLEEKGKHERVEVGILTVPAFVAQDVATRLVKIGVRGIWNYTPRKLDLPHNVICQDVKLSASFAVLSRRLINEQ